MRKIYDLSTDLKLFGIMLGLGKDEQQIHGNSYLRHKRILRMTKCLLYWYLYFTLSSSLTSGAYIDVFAISSVFFLYFW